VAEVVVKMFRWMLTVNSPEQQNRIQQVKQPAKLVEAKR
jgi:hypothetical protein